MVVIDSHVHLYGDVPPLAALTAGAARLLRLAPSAEIAALVLCDRRGQDYFSEICDSMQRAGSRLVANEWTLIPTAESVTFAMTRGQRQRAVVVRGQQIITAEQLEVLAFGHDTVIPDGRSLQRTIDQAESQKARVIIPWGAGKWLGKRGILLRAIVEDAAPSTVCLGDNGGRPWCWQVPHFSLAEKRNIKVLRGSDPLPVKGDHRRIGTYGSAFHGSLDALSPWRDLSTIIGDEDAAPMPVGNQMGVKGFVLSQSALRMPGRKVADSVMNQVG